MVRSLAIGLRRQAPVVGLMFVVPIVNIPLPIRITSRLQSNTMAAQW